MEIRMLPCPLCATPHFHGVDSLRTTLVGVATSPLACPVCQDVLMGLDKLTIHLFSHIVQNNTVIVTEEPPAPVQIENLPLEENLELIEEPVPPASPNKLICDICSFSFTDKNILEMHQSLLHQTTPDKTTGLYSYHCHLCSKKFRKKGSLMVHLRIAHYGFLSHAYEKRDKSDKSEEAKKADGKGQGKGPDNKQWACDVCQKLFTTKYFLKKHKRLHTGEMPYCCNLCNKSFTFQQSYHKHMLYHSSEKPYGCNECGRAFKELSTLQNHARIHSGERPFGCETCGKRFRQRVSYLVHRRIHTGVMPYKCTACEKSFRYKVSQKSHKCPMNPPGNVVKIPEPPDVCVPPQNSSNLTTNNKNVKCIMSVDYNTGNINFIQDTSFEKKIIEEKKDQANHLNHQIELRDTYVENCNVLSVLNNLEPTNGSPRPDYFSMLSPILPEMESLCLSNNSPAASNSNPSSPEENIRSMSEKCLEELFGASTCC